MKRGEVVVGLHVKVAVTLSGRGDDLGVLDRRPVRTRASQPYHEASEVSLAAAEKLIAKALAVATKNATTALRGLLDDMTRDGHAVVGAGIAFKTYRLPSTLEATIRSHPMCHAAEGQLTTDALFAACETLGLPVTAVGVEDGIDVRTEPVGKLIGAPWQKDHKLAATAALRAAGL